MKPRNKIQREVVALSATLHPISDEQRMWGISHSYTAKEIIQKKKLYRYFVISSRLKDWQVCRFFQIRKVKQNFHVIEPIRLWFNEKGHMEVEAMSRCWCSSMIDSWNTFSELSLKELPSSYKDYTQVLPISASKVTSMLPVLKRNGLKRSFHNMQPRDVIEGLLKNNIFETLWKCKQFPLLRAFAYEWNRYYNDTSIMAAVKIALRHDYYIKDGRMWLDMVYMLERAHKDFRNPKFVCPISLKAGHDKAMDLCNKYEEKQRKIKERKELLEDQKAVKAYEVARKRFIGMVISEGKVVIQVLATVKDVEQEGKIMHHCVFTNKYYKRLNSLLLTAKVNDEHLETIEVDLKRYQLVQSRGVCNQNSKYHDKIVNLVNKKMNLIRFYNKDII